MALIISNRILRVLIFTSALAFYAALAVHGEGPLSIQIVPRASNGWFRVQAPGQSEKAYVLEASTDLKQWLAIGRTRDTLLPFADPDSPNHAHRFYRVLELPLAAQDDGKNQIRFPDEAFLSQRTGSPADEVRWVKFAILRSEPWRVFYQESTKYPFHYDFAVNRLNPFIGWSRSAFDQVSLHTNGQQVVLGAVLFPPIGNVTEYGIQFVGLEPLPKETVASLFELVQSTVAAAPNVRAFYLPTFEQKAAAQADRAFFESKGIALSTLDRWLSGNQIYSSGWALGRLKFFSGIEISKAFAEGRLLPQDLLLTDGVPAEIPIVAGVISLAPSTPNSHVAILSRSFGIPFVYLADSSARIQAQQLTGKEVVLRAGRPETGGTVDLFGLDSALEPALKTEILALKAPQPIQIARKENYGSIVASTENLLPADIKYFGGKAANFGLLRQSIPSNAPVAIAFSFDLWDAFLNQQLATGRTLRVEIDQLLAGHSYPPNMPALTASLAAVRKLITDSARFSPELQQAVTNALKGFDAQRKIRFRSSTNVEDSEQFTGAGLYDSFSGCLADDLDGDDDGPSHCDPDEPKERGVFRAIQKVYASFYNDNAYLERLRHRINETEVGMGLLVHYSTPDTLEMANGVATLRFKASQFSTNIHTELVTQLGAVSVSNPDTTARPEFITATLLGNRTYLDANARSSLVPLGAYVLNREAEYLALLELLYAATDRFRRYYPGKQQFTLDFEYKKEQPGKLSVKQIREIPERPSTTNTAAYLLNTTNLLDVYQGEFGDVFSNHRLKSELALQTRNLKITDSNLAQSLFTEARLTYVDGEQINSITGTVPTFPSARFTRTDNLLTDSWTIGAASNQIRYSLITDLNRVAQSPEKVLLTSRDFTLRMAVDYAAPAPTLTPEGQATNTTHHEVMLLPALPADAPSAPIDRTIRTASGVEIRTRFLWHQPKTGGIGIKTSPLLRFEQTQIVGLVSAPIVLRGYYSQTYRPGHHNFTEEFVFEPALEPDLDPTVRNQLKAANIQLIYARWGDGVDEIQVLGWDSKFRRLGP